MFSNIIAGSKATIKQNKIATATNQANINKQKLSDKTHGKMASPEILDPTNPKLEINSPVEGNVSDVASNPR